jgi:hypothetical protein
VCRILLYTSLAFSAKQNSITIELSTPAAAAPDGMLLCATDARYRFVREDVSVSSLLEGGDIWQLTEEEQIAPTLSDWQNAPWLQATSGQWGLQPVEVASAGDVLGTDPYYSRSFVSGRFDDLLEDQDGIPIPPGTFDSKATAAAAAAPSPRSLVLPPGSSAAAARQRLSETWDAARPPGNCLLITGSWKQGRRYQLTVDIPNPPPPSGGTPAPPPSFWMGPLTYSNSSGGQLVYAVRGSKQGALCAPRPELRAATGPLFDACNATRSMGIAVPGPAGDVGVSRLWSLSALFWTGSLPLVLQTSGSTPLLHLRNTTPTRRALQRSEQQPQRRPCPPRRLASWHFPPSGC